MSKKDLKRQRIIQAAAEVFGNSNFQNAIISEIAQKANVAEGTLYQYFKNKEDLFFSIPAQKTEEFCEEFNLHLQGIHDAFSKLRKLIWYYLYFFKTNPAYARALMLEMRVSKADTGLHCGVRSWQNSNPRPRGRFGSHSAGKKPRSASAA